MQKKDSPSYPSSFTAHLSLHPTASRGGGGSSESKERWPSVEKEGRGSSERREVDWSRRDVGAMPDETSKAKEIVQQSIFVEGRFESISSSEDDLGDEGWRRKNRGTDPNCLVGAQACS